MLQQQLLTMGVPYHEVALLRSPGGLKQALRDDHMEIHDHAFKALQAVSRSQGINLSKADLRESVALAGPLPTTLVKGKRVGELDMIAGKTACESLAQLGRSVGIEFDFDVSFQWHPVDSQRMLFHASRFGSQEAYMDALARRHFTQRKASGQETTVLDAAKEVGLDPCDAKSFLDGQEYQSRVWDSYKATIELHGIHSIPFFVFNGPKTKGGPFRKGGVNSGELTVRGSGNVEEFLSVFERIRARQI